METFDLTYKDHLKKLAGINLVERAQALKLEMRSNSLIIPFFGRQHFISQQGVIDFDGKAPTPAVATVLLNYTLRNTGVPPVNPEKYLSEILKVPVPWWSVLQTTPTI